MKVLFFGYAVILAVMLVLMSCSSVEIKDNEWCVIAGTDGAYCFHTLSEKERDLTQPEWLVESRSWLAGSPETYANLKEALEKLCSETKKCSYETEEKMKKFFSKIEKAQEKAKPSNIQIRLNPDTREYEVSTNPDWEPLNDLEIFHN